MAFRNPFFTEQAGGSIIPLGCIVLFHGWIIPYQVFPVSEMDSRYDKMTAHFCPTGLFFWTLLLMVSDLFYLDDSGRN
jgi:hypothetical protein